jgi:hypothetical protein
VTRATVVVVAVFIALSGCAVESASEVEPVDARDNVEEQGIFDCTESQATGYKNGNPFPITVVTVDGKPVEEQTANAYIVMQEAAANDGIGLRVVSGFRTMAEQQYLYACYVNCNCNSCNLAAQPGYSNHQSGHAIDFNTSDPGVLDWMNAHANGFGWQRTVPSEVWHWEWWGGGPGGGPCGQPVNQAPRGYLDGVDCNAGVLGWAQDPDVADAPIRVDMYFDGPAGAGVGYSTMANIHRDDLCAAIGSCEHGFDFVLPRKWLDNAPHTVFAYGIDSAGGNNPLLSAAPATFTCAPPALPSPSSSFVLRHVLSPDAMAALQFSFDDVAVYPALDGFAVGADFPTAAPQLIQANGEPPVYVVDGDGSRRWVTSPDSLNAWHFTVGAIVVEDPAVVHAMPMGALLPDAPVLVRGNGPEVYVVDAAPPSWGIGSGVGVADDATKAVPVKGAGASTHAKPLPPSVVASCASAPSSTFALFSLLALVRLQRGRRRANM